jgi:uncharacterized 2Fe-2S/4Fe-4S cluster protein (DUF4445 family)
VPALACALRPRKPVTIAVPPETVAGAGQILTDGIYVKVEPRPNVRVHEEDGRAFIVLGEAAESRRLRRRPSGCYGVALDLGTTTLVASLFDLPTGMKLAVASSLDPQISLGEDVVSRINLALAEKDAPARLHSLLLDEVNRLVREACAMAKINPGDVFDAVAVGNTFMHHSFLGLPLGSLAESPYTPAATRELEMPAREAGLRIHRLGRAYLPPIIAGFLGSDALGGALAAGLDRAARPTLYIDLGTNGELLLALDGKILGSTTAAGPAFEGAQIECGMRASEGAISAVRLVEKAHRKRPASGRSFRPGRPEVVHGGAGRTAQGAKTQGTTHRAQGFGGERNEEDEDVSTLAPCASRHAPSRRLEIETIGGKPARGIAGSGLVDAAAALLDAGALDRRGNLVTAHPMVRQFAGAKHVVLASRPMMVYLSQGDIRSLQLAKAAIAAGTQVLLDNAGITGEEVEQVLLAGAFGNYLDRYSAMRIGLLPPVELNNVLGLGNAASTGAGMMLVSMNERRRAVEMARKIEYIELAGNDRFRELFVDCLAFP